MKSIAAIALLLLIALPALAYDNCAKHSCDSRCHGHEHYNHQCQFGPVTNLVTINLTNRYLVVETVYLTNVVNVTNTVTSTNQVIEFRDYSLRRGGIYRLYLMTQTADLKWRKWTPAGSIQSWSNHVARVVLPSASLHKTMWELRDYSPGRAPYPLEPLPPTNAVVVTYIGLGQRLLRAPDKRP